MRAGVPMELEFIVGKCLAKNRNDRPSSAEEIARDLRTLGEKLKSGRSTVLHTGIVPGPPAASTQHTGQAESAPLPGPLAKYRVIEDGQETGDTIRYVAEDTELRRSVAIRVLPQSSEQQIERAQRRKQTVAYGVGALGVLLALVFAFFPLFSPTPVAEVPLRRSAFTPPVAVVNTDPFSAGVAISPNGKHVAYTTTGAEGNLWVQDLDQEQPRAIERTEGAYLPFWSPDSDFIGFAAGSELQKVPVQGGPPMPLCEMPGTSFRSGSWSPDGGTVAFSSGTAGVGNRMIYEVSAQGGVPSLLIGPEDPKESPKGPTGSISRPHFLPTEADRRVLVFTFGTLSTPEMVVQDLETGTRQFLGPGNHPFYSPSGHLLYQYQSELNVYDLWALPFSLETLQGMGEAFPIAQNGRQPTVAADNTLVLDSYVSAQEQLIWVGRDGKKVEEIGLPQERILEAAISPDGGRMAVSVSQGANFDVWVWDLASGVKTRLSTAPELDLFPVWSPAGDEVAFASLRSDNADIYLRPADGSGDELTVAATSQREWPSDWSGDGQYLLYTKQGPETGSDLWYLERSEDGGDWEPHPFLQERLAQAGPKFSPNGRYVAYMSAESGQREVYVQPFPEGGRKVTVSNSGGTQVRWSPDGKELFYVEVERLMAVVVSTEGEFSASPPVGLFKH